MAELMMLSTNRLIILFLKHGSTVVRCDVTIAVCISFNA